MRRKRDESGAVFLEFALVLPVFMVLILGTFSGAQAYNLKQSVTSGAREGSRYGASLPVNVNSSCGGAAAGPTTVSTNWLTCVSNDVVQAASGDLNQGTAGRYVCVSFVTGSGTSIPTYSRYVSTSDSAPTYSNSSCYTLNSLTTDTLSVPHVQVVTKRTANLEWMVAATPLTLQASSVTLFEGPLS